VGVAWATHRPAESCGIVGVVGGEDAVGFLLEGLTILRNRGYDSAGIASIASDGQGQLTVTKYASQNSTADSIDLVRAHSGKHLGHSTGIGHTRWATHGGKTDQVTGACVFKSPPGQTLVSSPTTRRTTPLISPLLALGTSGQNAHPHSDAKGRVAVIHNGTINNSYDLKKELIAAGVKFQSETDTEVISFRPAFITTTVQYCHLASALGQTPVLWPPSLRPHLNPLCPISHQTPVACR
jgi:glucosamine--fructose-6-phosphate aminotransferase (isomerizing)